MKNKIKFFDRGVFLEALNQLKIVGIIACAIYLSAGILTPIGYMIEGPNYDYQLKQWIPIEFEAEYFTSLIAIMYLFVPIMLLVIFFWMNKRNSCDFYHALPVKRGTIFVSTIAAVYAWTFIIIAVAVVVPLFIVGFHPMMITDMEIFWKIILYIIAGVVLVTGAFSLGISITGNGFTNVMASLMILCVPRIIMTIITIMIEEFMPFIRLGVGTSLLNINYNAVLAPFIGVFYYGENSYVSIYASVGYSCILGLIYTALAGVLFKKRKSEAAAQPSAYNIVQIVCRMIPAFLFSLIGTYFFLETTIKKQYDIEAYFIAVVWYVVALLIYFIYELITTRRWRKVGASVKQLPIFVGIVVFSGLAIGLGTNQAMNREIKPDEIEYMEFEPLEGTSYFSKNKNVKITDKELYKLIKNAYEEQLDAYYTENYSYYEDWDVDVCIKQNGIKFYRKVYLNDYEMSKIKSAYVEALDNANNSVILPEYEFKTMDLYLDIDGIKDEQLEELYGILRDEAKNLSYKQLFNMDEYDSMAYIEIYNNVDYEDSWWYIEIPVSDATPKAKSYLMSVLLENAKQNNIEEYEYLFESDVNIIGIDMTFTIVNKDTTEELYVYIYEHYTDTETLTGLETIFKTLQSTGGDSVVIVNGYLEIYDEYGYEYGENYCEWINGVFRVDDELADEIREMATEYYE